MLALLAATVASAHEPGLSRAVVGDDALTLALSKVDATAAEHLLDDAVASVGGTPCTLGPATVGPSGPDGVEVRRALHCPAGDAVAVEAGWLPHLPPGHRTVISAGGSPVGFVDRAHASLVVPRAASSAAIGIVGFVALGIEHILTGFDHLAFLTGLLLVARSWREAAKVATGFTVAHSITLSLAVLGLVRVSPSIVEPAIGATILWVGLENLAAPPPTRRLVLTMFLGLVHGLGFADLLGSLGLSPRELPVALVSFNGGVELGQFAVIAVVLPVLLLLRRDARWTTYGVRWGSLALAALGAFWLVSRVIAAAS